MSERCQNCGAPKKLDVKGRCSWCFDSAERMPSASGEKIVIRIGAGGICATIPVPLEADPALLSEEKA